MKTSTQKLRNAILVIMGSSALIGVSNQAHAFNAISLGEFTGSPISVVTNGPKKAFSDYQISALYCCSNNQGWMHTTNWWQLQVGTAADIAAGTTFNVQLKAQGTTAAPLDNPSFVVWTVGAGSYTAVNLVSHGWNPTRGPNDSTGWTGNTFTGNNAIGQSGIIDGHDGWIGYVNSAASYTLTNFLDPINSKPQTGNVDPVTGETFPYYDNVLGVSPGNTATYTAADGVLNSSSPWLTNPGASSTFATALNTNGNNNANPDYSVMNLFGLKAGNYIIASSGACPSGFESVTPLNACSNAQTYQFSVSTIAAVPVPAAVWLFGSAMAGMLSMQRRKRVIA